MKNIKHIIILARRQSGQSLAEYAVIISIVMAACVAAVTLISAKVQEFLNLFNNTW
jgi:Flp pilus assembly pilin Flp